MKGFQKARVTGFELDPDEAKKSHFRAGQLGLKNVNIHADDFLQWAIDHLDDKGTRFDAVVGNPPFVRYQYLPEPFQHRAEQIFSELKLPFTKHTNAWVPFILASMALLRAGGRLAMVVPAEIIHVTHAQSLRSYLGSESAVALSLLIPRNFGFLIPFRERSYCSPKNGRAMSDHAEGLGMYPVKGREFLRLDPSAVFNAPTPINGKNCSRKVDASAFEFGDAHAVRRVGRS